MIMINEDRFSDRNEQYSLYRKIPLSKIRVPTEYDKTENAWKDSVAVVSKIGIDSVYSSDCHYDYYCEDLEGYLWNEQGNFKIFFFAFDEADAKDRLECFKKFKKYQSSEYKFTEPEKIADTKAEGEAKLQEYLTDEKYKYWDKGNESSKKILCLPTSQMYEEMKRSIDWAINIVKKMKDKDSAAKKEEWLKSPDGIRWKELFDKEQKLLAKEAAAQETRDRHEEERKMFSKDVEDCFFNSSELHPEYNGLGIVPVIVKGGKKFQGVGFVINILTVTNSYGYYALNVESDMVKIWLPNEPGNKMATANLKFCKLDTSVTPERCRQVLDDYCREKVLSTMDWCRQKDPSKSEIELKRWAANIMKKYHPEIDIDRYIGDLGDVKTDQVKSTANWACGLPDATTAAKAEKIIIRALNKKGINPFDYSGVIAPIVIAKFGKTKNFR